MTHCAFENCYTRPSYNYKTEKNPMYCKYHKNQNMINLFRKKCLSDNCFIVPTYNYKTEKNPLYCSSHRLSNMYNIVYKKCTSCNLFETKKKSNFLCSYCNPIKIKTVKHKELSIKSLLQSNNITFTHNFQITNNCFKFHPDFLIDCTTYYIILEIDEYAHYQYNKVCELIRMNNIITCTGLPTKFIRYNPDKKGISKKLKHQKLVETLKKEINKDFLVNLEPIYLFY